MTGTNGFLVNYAIRNFWCNQGQNKQAIFKMARLTSFIGVTNSVSLMMNAISLPTNLDTYHVFQIGQLTPELVGLIEASPNWAYQQWTSMQDTMNMLPVFIDLYTTNGIHIPRYDVYYRFTRSKDLIIAIKYNKKIPIDYGNEDIYIRLYSNAYYNIVGNSSLKIFSAGKTFLNTQDILNFQVLYSTYTAMDGAVLAYSNGLLVDGIDLINVAVGDSAEFIYDPSVKRVLSIPVSGLESFISTLDSGEPKYLIQDYLSNNSTINYERDIDIYITAPFGTNKYQGIYYHRNAEDSHRMLTHRDYSISVAYLTSLGMNFQTLAQGITIGSNSLAFPNLGTLNLKVFIRNSGYNHSLVFENNRIHDLYKLDLIKVNQAMVGLNSTVTNWQAPVLEASAYAAVMQDKIGSLNDLLVQSALGYNAYSVLVANTPSPAFLSSGQLVAEVPPGLQSNYTAYEYDVNGVMLTHQTGNAGNTYNASNLNTSVVEMLYGTGSYTPDVYFGTNNINVPSNCNYRVYQEANDGSWSDITNSNKYTVTNNVLIWNSAVLPLLLMVRTDRTILAYDINMLPVDGLLYFTFSEMENRTGTILNYTMPFPMGDLDIFLNGKSLIEGIDYIVNFPEIVILNINALVQPANSTMQNIHVRWSGFCNSDLTYRTAIDTGFIANNALSNGNKYDILDDGVLRIIVGGKYITKSALAINDSVAGVGVTGGFNGMPYAVKKPLIPIQNLVNTDLLSFNSEAIATDALVSNYLTAFLPKLTEPLMSIPQRYSVLSPFICKILYQLLNNEVNTSVITTSMSDMDILTFCKPYEKWLMFDPIYTKNTIDPRFVVVVPTNILNTVGLPLNYYSFLLRVVSLYTKGLVNLASYIVLAPL